MKTHWPSFALYVLIVLSCTWLTYLGRMPGEFLGALIGVSIPRPWKEGAS